MKKKAMLLLVALSLISGCTTLSSSNPSQSEESSGSLSDSLSESGESSNEPSSEVVSSSEVSSLDEASSSLISEEFATLTRMGKKQTINELQIEVDDRSGVPSIGDIDVLVIPVEIKGSAFPSDYATKLDLMFNGTSSATGWESVSSYYTKSSYGALNLNFDIMPKFTTSQTKTYYEGFNIGSGSNAYNYGDQVAIIEALNNVTGIDYSNYDFNNDGDIDSVIFIYSVAYSDTDPWWAWVYTEEGFENRYTTLKNGKSFNYYMWASYSFMTDKIGVTTTVNAETYIHEFGHLLGFPDLYSTSYNYGPLGDWDMMDYNTGDHGPFNKLSWGWIDPYLTNGNGTYEVTLDAYSTDNDGLNNALVIPSSTANFADGDVFDEYVILIYYTPEGVYTGHLGTSTSLSQSGIAIYRVNAKLLSSRSIDFWEFFYYNNQGTSNFLVELLEADANNSIPSKSKGINNTDLLHSGTLDLNTNKWSNGTAINVSITVESLSTQASLKVVLS